MAANRPRKKLTKVVRMQHNLLIKMIRSHNYDSFPKAVNKMVECVSSKKLGVPWDELYDTLMHIDDLYQNMVCNAHVHFVKIINKFVLRSENTKM